MFHARHLARHRRVHLSAAWALMSKDEQQKQGELVPICDPAIDLLGVLVQARRDRAQHTLHHFTCVDKVNR